ncbi:LPS export ABC transporter periplasmic protein LptC [Oscillatoriales cyanobacterium USR001]|nr:LPS export ABC transporter periplasmic protein LptC [Oscillatoriales cyanobacterium USR001]
MKYLNFTIHKIKLSRIVRLGLVTLLLGIVACGNQSEDSQANKLAEDINTAQKSNSSLTLSDVTMEQANEKGEKLWTVKSEKATYSKDKKIVNVKNPKGVLFQDGKEVYQIQSETGEVHQDGNQVILKGKIIATDPLNGIVLRGNELEWRPKEDLLIVRNNLTGDHKQAIASAKEARVFSRAKRMELFGQVVANVKDPVLQLRTEHLIWMLDRQKMIGDLPVQIDRYQGKVISDRAYSDQADVDLKLKIANLTKNAQLMPSDPPLQISSNMMSWNFPAELVVSPGPVTVIQLKEKVTMRGNQGRGDLERDIFYLTGNVVGIGQKRNSQLNTDNLIWYFKNQTFDAVGNVVYRQIDPEFNSTGPKAAGQLKDETVTVTGDVNGGQVVTEIITKE